VEPSSAVRRALPSFSGDAVYEKVRRSAGAWNEIVLGEYGKRSCPEVTPEEKLAARSDRSKAAFGRMLSERDSIRSPGLTKETEACADARAGADRSAASSATFRIAPSRAIGETEADRRLAGEEDLIPLLPATEKRGSKAGCSATGAGASSPSAYPHKHAPTELWQGAGAKGGRRGPLNSESVSNARAAVRSHNRKSLTEEALSSLVRTLVISLIERAPHRPDLWRSRNLIRHEARKP
jgi:hypothetical protein